MWTYEQIVTRTGDFIWRRDLRDASIWLRGAQRAVQIVVVTGRNYFTGNINLHAMSLVYITLLALFPALAIAFSVLKGFGVDQELERALTEFLTPLGSTGTEIRDTVIRFVEQVNVGLLGSVGLAALVWTGVSLLQKVEAALNEIWQVRRLRPLARRFSDFVLLLLTGPLLMVVAMGLLASVAGSVAVVNMVDSESVRAVVDTVAGSVPFLVTVLVFCGIYMVLPNAKVHIVPALVGAFFAAVAWHLVGWVFAAFIVKSARYVVIYSAFASLVLFMLWIYAVWLILLIGSSIAFYLQNPAYLTKGTVYRLSIADRERLGLDVAFFTADAFMRGEKPWTVDQLAHALHLPLPPVERIVAFLLDAGLLCETAAEPPGLMPARPPDKIGVKAVLEVVRSGAEGQAELQFDAGRVQLYGEDPVQPVITRLDKARNDALDGMTLRDLVEARGTAISPRPATVAVTGD